MKLKRNILILFISVIITAQALLLVNNNQKSNFKIFVWDIKEITIGRLITISFMSGLLVSFILNINQVNIINTFNSNIDPDKEIDDEFDPFENQFKNDSNEIPPERDLRDVQPTISVNYRVIKNNIDNPLNDKNRNLNNSEEEDDWDRRKAEW